uniref:Uncharacterized protein n=1 Tax=Anguilla anguilla TaxID=7936 RepID=A0A0E9RF68_ANGAN
MLSKNCLLDSLKSFSQLKHFTRANTILHMLSV